MNSLKPKYDQDTGSCATAYQDISGLQVVYKK